MSLSRLGVYVFLLVVGIAASPAQLHGELYRIGVVGLACVLLVQLRTTRNALDHALAWIALWAVVAVLVAPFLPLFHALGVLPGGAR
jgi:hypothetical protein